MEKAAMAIKECPSCGAEIQPSYSEEWLPLLEDSTDKKDIICSQCGASLSDDKNTDDNVMQTDEKNIAKNE